ncbi:MAG: uroporphyrinogen-III synthase [Puniceicoccales bacterium]|jgi:uroporphyrinogen-III synthase|nr:uroporphyrinogen-III synthase [Puniceicoccales bacterium]
MKKTALPLFTGKRIVITRPQGAATQALREVLAGHGATVLEVPLLDIEYAADAATLAAIWAQMGQYDWLVFTSANGVQGFFERYFESFDDIRGLGICRIACVGPATVAAVRAYHLHIDHIPPDATAAALAEELASTEDLSNQRVLIIAGTRNSDVLARTLEEKSRAIVQTLTVYATEENDVSALAGTEDFREHGADAIVFASPSAVESFVAQASRLTLRPGAFPPKTVAIGPTTAAALREHGIPVAAQAAAPAQGPLVAAIAEACAIRVSSSKKLPAASKRSKTNRQPANP